MKRERSSAGDRPRGALRKHERAAQQDRVADAPAKSHRTSDQAGERHPRLIKASNERVFEIWNAAEAAEEVAAELDVDVLVLSAFISRMRKRGVALKRFQSGPRLGRRKQRITGMPERIASLVARMGTAREAAKLCDLHPSKLALHATGKGEPTLSDLVKICYAFNVTSDWLLGIEGGKDA